MKHKLLKICDVIIKYIFKAFGAIVYTLPNESEIKTKLIELTNELNLTDEIMSHTKIEINE